MPKSYTQILYHIVFSTKNREPTLPLAHHNELFRYIWGIHNNLHCRLHRINGGADHLHMLTSLHPSVCLADYVREVKTGSAHWIKANGQFPNFTHWQDGYGAFTLSIREKDTVIDCIKGQGEHHKVESYLDEYRRLLHEAGITFDARYLA